MTLATGAVLTWVDAPVRVEAIIPERLWTRLSVPANEVTESHFESGSLP